MTEVEIFFDQFENWALLDIELLLRLKDDSGKKLKPDRRIQAYHRPFVASVILMCCAIDCLSAFRYGRRDGDGVGQQYKKFIREYFPNKYDNVLVYKGLRNALIHGYSMDGVGLSHTNKRRHLAMENERVVFDVFTLFDDLCIAYGKYKTELGTGKYLSEFRRRSKKHPIARWVGKSRAKI